MQDVSLHTTAKRTDLGRVLATLATILILLLGAAFALPAFVDWNGYRSGIEKTASALLGQKVSILGDIDIVLLPQPHLRASSVASGIGQADSALLTADAIDISLSLQSLLGGRLEAGKVKLVRPSLTLDFAKPLQKQGPPAEASTLPFTAEVRSVEIESGRLAILSRKGGPAEALALSKINGVAAVAAPGGAYRFNGYFSQNDRTYEIKLSGAPAQPRTIRLSGSAVDMATRASFQADGSVSTSQDPSFEGALTLTLPPSPAGLNRVPFDIQLKSAARIGLTDAVLNDLVLTLDPQNRPQVLAGSGAIAFNTKDVGLALQARSLDADLLLQSSSGGAAAAGAAEAADWSALGAAAGHFLWLYPGFAVNLSLEAGLVQLKGEAIESVKIHGSRTAQAQRWVFDQAAATLPGGTSAKLAGTLSRAGGLPQFAATAAFDGKNAGRLARWLAPSLLGTKTIPASAFNLKGAITLSDAAYGLEGVAGNVDGTAITASLRFEKAPLRKLQLSLSGDSFDLSAFDNAAESPGSLSPANLKSAWQTGLEQATSLLGAGPEGLDSADVDISAGNIRTGGAEARNVAVHVKFGQDMVVVSKLSAETASGLVLRGEGSVPLRGAGQGRFDGRIEARSSQAVVQAAALGGYGRAVIERRAGSMAPAALSISYNSEAASGVSTALLTGNLGPARIEGRAQLKGPLQAWKTGQLSAQVKISEPDGNKLLGLLFPSAVLAPGASLSPGVLALGLNGDPDRFETSATINTGALQLQLDGASGIDGQSITFKGKASASSQTPEQFLPPSLLALLGGEPKANMHVSATVSAAPGRIDANELKAETPRNFVSGHLAADASGTVTRLDADLKADQASLPSLLGYFLASTPADPIAQALPAALGAPGPAPDLWSGRPFSMPAFQETAGKVSLTAKTLKLSDAIVLTDARLRASLDNGRLDFESLRGQTLGGLLDAVLSLTAKENSTVAAEARITLSSMNLSSLAGSGTPPIATGSASLSLTASGRGLSPLGLIPVLTGRGDIQFSAGRLAKLSPRAVRLAADELLASPQPLTEEIIAKKTLEAAQSGDFDFNRHSAPVTIRDGVLEIAQASFPGNEASIRMEAFLDLSKMQADTSWELIQDSAGHQKLSPVKIMLSGAVRDLGSRPRALAAEDFVRAVLVRKMEGDISRLEGLNSSNKLPASTPAWTTTQQPVPKKNPKKGREGEQTGNTPAASGGASGQTRPAGAAQAQSFEQRMRDFLENRTSNPPTR
jgi:uncharacterized protein involved in outer membrane biogenesis